ncbi:MAG: hypothetical protein JOZ52_02720 [Acidobacteria bacterium]|nr:hypothetical protein [Acidobacteriota bacterium]
MEDRNQTGAQPANQESESSTRSQSQTGDPGRTPGTAEGDRETVEQDVNDKLGNSDAESN